MSIIIIIVIITFKNSGTSWNLSTADLMGAASFCLSINSSTFGLCYKMKNKKKYTNKKPNQ